MGWQVSTVKDTTSVEACLRMALWRRDHARPLKGLADVEEITFGWVSW